MNGASLAILAAVALAGPHGDVLPAPVNRWRDYENATPEPLSDADRERVARAATKRARKAAARVRGAS